MSPISSSSGFTAPGRHIVDEDFIELTSVGVDIGSSTSHLAFSRLELQREGTRYVVTNRQILYESNILLTPYLAGTTVTIDGLSLSQFIAREYAAAGLHREEVDTGALILTGNALLKQNSRTIGEVFAQEAGKFVAVSAGDSLEAVMAAHGSGAVALSAREQCTALNIDIGGGTSKLAICREGKVLQTAAIDVGARLLAWDAEGKITRLEESGRRAGRALGFDFQVGQPVQPEQLDALAAYLADRLLEMVRREPLSPAAEAMLRTPPLTYTGDVDVIIFSGGVSEFIYNHEAKSFGDLGERLAAAVRARVDPLGIPIREPVEGIRATVIGASQYTIQVSGNTIFISELDAVPLRNIPVITPHFSFEGDDLDPAAVGRAIYAALHRSDALSAEWAVALAYHWEGSATYARIDAFCRGVLSGMSEHLSVGHPLVLVCDRDVGGLLGLHMKEELDVKNPIISIDGVELREFDYIDIGSLIPASGAVPVVIKSLIFPTEAERYGTGK